MYIFRNSIIILTLTLYHNDIMVIMEKRIHRLFIYIFLSMQNNIVLSLSCSGAATALLHPNGRIYQYGSRVEILAHDTHGNNKLVISVNNVLLYI